jgi:PKD repeat protein
LTSRTATLAAALTVVACTALATVPTAASADVTTIYVNNTTGVGCSDTAVDAGTSAQPFCTLQTAVNAAQPGDTVQIVAGGYKPVDIKTSGTATAPITITGTGYVTTPANEPVPALSFDHVHDVVVSRLSLATQTPTTTVAVVGSSDVSLEHVQVGGLGASPDITVDGQSSSVTISQSEVTADRGTAVSIASGATGTVLTTDGFRYGLGPATTPAVTAVDAPGTAVVSNTFSETYINCASALSLTGASTGSVIENNAVIEGTGSGGCSGGTSTPVIVSADSAVGTTADYNTIETPSTGPLYQWGAQSYSSPSALTTATGQAAHDSTLTITPGQMANGATLAPLIDSADANAPHELSTDLLGKSRVDDPLVSNTGTGPGYYDRGAVETQDPYAAAEVPSAYQGPVGFTETFGLSESNPWHTQISSYTFDFGDGSAPVTTTSPTTTHTYTTKGTYEPVITVTAAGGAVFHARITAEVRVVAPAPLVPAIFAIRQEGSTLAMIVDGLPSADAWSIQHYTFDYGDGTTPASVGWNQSTTHTYAQPGTYTITMTATDDGGNTATTTRVVHVGSAFMPFGPTRFLDTRYGTGAPKAKVGQHGVIRLKVTGVQGLPATGVTAVTLNLTGLNATTGTWVAAYPDGTSVPTASNLNLTPGQITSNQVTVPVSADGYVDLYNYAGSADLIADVEGYYSAGTMLQGAGQGYVVPQAPVRVLDTRSGTGAPAKAKVGPGQSVTFQVPSGNSLVSAVVLNVTETDATANSYVAVDQAGGTPSTSVLNFSAGQTSSNQVLVPLVNRSSIVTLYNHAGSTDLIADVQGFVSNGNDAMSGQPLGSPYFPVAPTRIVDTRTGLGAPEAPIGARSHVAVKVAGVNGIPSDATAVLVNLTGVMPSAATYVSAYPDGSTPPNSSNLNQAAGTDRAVLALVPVGPDGSIDLYNNAGSINLVADIEGYYTE